MPPRTSSTALTITIFDARPREHESQERRAFDLFAKRRTSQDRRPAARPSGSRVPDGARDRTSAVRP